MRLLIIEDDMQLASEMKIGVERQGFVELTSRIHAVIRRYYGRSNPKISIGQLSICRLQELSRGIIS